MEMINGASQRNHSFRIFVKTNLEKNIFMYIDIINYEKLTSIVGHNFLRLKIYNSTTFF